MGVFRFALGGAAALLFAGLAGTANAQEFRLKLHHFLSPLSHGQVGMLVPWVKAIEEQSQGRIKIDIFPSMQLGGSPPQLIDQARDGVVDIVWTLPGYTPGRFTLTEVFE
ncbi:MAG: C4-dicarboxylate ABC transporter, partial [Rhodospirillaceae bacterium]|nr:C4-dicarboxylate ABC transporter [Rhodospirillaceae bacterium]